MNLRRRWCRTPHAAALAISVSVIALPVHAQQAPAAHFFIRAFRVNGNHLLAREQVETIVYPFMGPDRTADDVEHARAALQEAFQKQGYATVTVSIPEQGVESGIIVLSVQPQTVGQLVVTGVGPKAAARIEREAPSLQPGAVPNFTAVQNDIAALNQTADRRVTPEVKAGVAPGTVDVTLDAKESLALHGSVEFNNDQSPETSEYRVLGTLHYDDLWGRGDSITLSGQTAPQRPKDATVGSVNYLTHLGPVQLLGYYVYSDSDVAVVGGTDVVGKGNMGGVRLIAPVSQSPSFYQSVSLGLDWKDFGEDVRLGSDLSKSPISYFPVTVGWRGDWTGKAYKSDLSLSAVFGLRGLGDGQAAFDAKRFDASPNFFLVKFEATHTQDLWWGTQAYGHLSGQWSRDPLISNEEFSIGGLSTVRGYDESELLGDYGIAFQGELRTPNLLTYSQWSDWMGPGFNELRLHAFYDVGWEGIHSPLIGQAESDWLTAIGGGATLKLLNHANGSVDIGVPLVGGPNTKVNSVFARFRLWGDF
jgi:hemolysin activation/secretion protein